MAFNAKRGLQGVKRGVKPLAKRSAKMVKKLAPYAIGGAAGFALKGAGRIGGKKAAGKIIRSYDKIRKKENYR